MNKKQRAEMLEKHRKFLRKMGLTEKTVAKNKPSTLPSFLSEGIAHSYQANLSNKIEGGQNTGKHKGILLDVIGYTDHDRAIVNEMAKSISVEYNKGGLQYISAGTDLTKMGKKV